MKDFFIKIDILKEDLKGLSPQFLKVYDILFRKENWVAVAIQYFVLVLSNRKNSEVQNENDCWSGEPRQ